MLQGIYMMDNSLFPEVYNESTQQAIEEKVQIINPLVTREMVKDDNLPPNLESVDVIFAGWGAPKFDKNLLDKMPQLKVIFYAAGTMKNLLTEEVWTRDIRVTTANTTNAKPVADYTLGAILLSLKNVWSLSRKTKANRLFYNGVLEKDITGIYQATVGIISMSQVGKMVINHLKDFDVDILSYDPYVSQKEADAYGVKMVDLDTLMSESDVVSLHTPLLAETEGMINGELLNSMKPYTTFINTARGAIVKEDEMINVLKNREDLTAILDVTSPEPPVKESPLYDMENVILTPHIAGSVGNEKARLGETMLEELTNYVTKGNLTYEISKESYQNMA